jgi:hypothetical protein
MNEPAAEEQCVEEKVQRNHVPWNDSHQNKLVKIILPGASRFSSVAAWDPRNPERSNLQT